MVAEPGVAETPPLPNVKMLEPLNDKKLKSAARFKTRPAALTGVSKMTKDPSVPKVSVWFPAARLGVTLFSQLAGVVTAKLSPPASQVAAGGAALVYPQSVRAITVSRVAVLKKAVGEPDVFIRFR